MEVFSTGDADQPVPELTDSVDRFAKGMADQSNGSRASYDKDNYHPVHQYQPREVSHVHDIATGALEGGLGVLATEPLLAAVTGEKVLNPFRGGFGPVAKRVGAGAAIGGAATGLIGALVSHAESKRKEDAKKSADRRRAKVLGLEDLRPGIIELDNGIINNPSARRGVRVDHYEKNIQSREINRGVNDHLRAAAVGAVAGLIIPHKTAGALKRAGVGAAGGVGLLTALRAIAKKDIYGDTSPEAKQTQAWVPVGVAAGAVGFGIHKRIKASRNSVAALKSVVRPTATGAAKETASGVASNAVGLSRVELKVIEFARRSDTANIDDTGNQKNTVLTKRNALPIGAAVAAGAGTYAALRYHKSPLPEGASPQMKALRKAADRSGFARVALHDTEGSKPTAWQKIVSEISQPADVHEHVGTGRSYTPKKFGGAIFDPDDTGLLEGRPGAKLGEENKVTDFINKGKLEEYHLATQAGLEMPHTAELGDPLQMPHDYIAKPAHGSASKSVVTRQMIDEHDPDHPLLKDFQKFRKNVSSKIKNENERGIAENTHPGYKRWMTGQAIKRPDNFVMQKKIDIAEEYRVHTLGGKSIGVTSSRFGLAAPMAHREAEAAAEAKLANVHPRLKDNLLAMDMAKDKTGDWHVIETNPGAASGFLSPHNKLDMRGPHSLYKAVTGRYARPTSIAGGVAAAGVAGVGTELLSPPRRDRQN